MALLNLTSHDINIVIEGQPELVIPSSGDAKVVVKQNASQITGLSISVPIFVTSFGEVTGLPAEQAGIYYIVSTMVRTALPQRKDLMSPSTNPKYQLRNAAGQMIGCKAFDANI